MLAPRLAKRYALGPTILGSMIVGCFAPILIVLARPGSSASVILPFLSFFVGGIGVAISNVHVVSLRQSITPDELLGRMTASYRTVIYGTLPLGALLGGFLGETLGLRPALAVGALGMLLALPWVVFSPLRRLRTL
jgi:predicted MFS family arabinose efflux permease